MTTFTTPKTHEQKAAAAQGVELVLKEIGAGSKNELSRQTGFTRNSVSFWFSRGYIGRRAALVICEKFGYKLEQIRPDMFLE
jgi:hypothetical protein